SVTANRGPDKIFHDSAMVLRPCHLTASPLVRLATLFKRLFVRRNEDPHPRGRVAGFDHRRASGASRRRGDDHRAWTTRGVLGATWNYPHRAGGLHSAGGRDHQAADGTRG